MPSVDHPESATVLARYPQKCNCACALPAKVGKKIAGKKFNDCADTVAFIQWTTEGVWELATSAIESSFKVHWREQSWAITV